MTSGTHANKKRGSSKEVKSKGLKRNLKKLFETRQGGMGRFNEGREVCHKSEPRQKARSSLSDSLRPLLRKLRVTDNDYMLQK